MPLYLKITAIALLSIILFSFRKYTYIKAKHNYRSTIYNAVTQPLIKVHLKPELATAWANLPAVQSILTDFHSIGFVSGKSYAIPELNDMSLQSLFLGNYAAAIVKHPTAGCWAEVYFQREDGKFFVASNSPIGEEHNSHQDNKILYLRDASAIGLYNQLKLETERTFGVLINEENFKSVIVKVIRKVQ